jgi:hypothetical protein
MAAMGERAALPSPLHIARDELAELLSTGEVLREERTGVTGVLRVISVGGAILVEEESPAGEILLRPRPDSEAANAFVDRRLRQYEKMWDG